MDDIINLTPHEVTIDGLCSIPPSGRVARVDMTEEVSGAVDGVTTIRRRPNGVSGLPEERSGTILIVSSMVLDALRQIGCRRRDVYAPDTGPASAVRDADGRIVAVRRLVSL